MKHSNKSKTKPKSHNQSGISMLSFEGIGTLWNIELFQPISEARHAVIKREILNRIDSFDIQYSRFRPDSFVSKMTAEPGRYHLPDDAKPLMDFYERMYKITDGVVTPLIGTTLSEAGYDATYTLQPKPISEPPTWNEALAYDFPFLTVKLPVILDFGAAGKGYLVDIISELLVQQNVRQFCVNAGGDMYYYSESDDFLQVGLENPEDTSEALGIATIHNQSLCGSAGNRRQWDKYHHIINPITLESPKHIKAVWVTADSGLLADGLTTALFFCSPEILREHFSFDYAIVYHDNSLQVSAKFPAQFFTTKEGEAT